MLLCVPRGKVLDFWGQNKSTAVLIKIPESVPFSQYVFLPVVLLAGNFWKMLREMSRSSCFGGCGAKAILPSHGGWLVARGRGKPVWLSDIWGLLASVWRERLPRALQHLHRQARLVAAPSGQRFHCGQLRGKTIMESTSCHVSKGHVVVSLCALLWVICAN